MLAVQPRSGHTLSNHFTPLMPSHPPWPHPLHLPQHQHQHDRHSQSPGGYSPSPSSSHPHPHPPPPLQRYPATSTYSEILPRLYISDLGVPENPQLLASLGITHVLSIMRGFVDLRPQHTHIKHTQIQLDDLPFAELAAVLPSTTAFIHAALDSSPHATVLVHCVQGVSRSASVVSAYLMWRYGWSVKESVGYVKRKRPLAEPSYGFMGQLGEYSELIRGHGRPVR